MIMSLKHRKLKKNEPRIKLNYNIYMYVVVNF